MSILNDKPRLAEIWLDKNSVGSMCNADLKNSFNWIDVDSTQSGGLRAKILDDLVFDDKSHQEKVNYWAIEMLENISKKNSEGFVIYYILDEFSKKRKALMALMDRLKSRLYHVYFFDPHLEEDECKALITKPDFHLVHAWESYLDTGGKFPRYPMSLSKSYDFGALNAPIAKGIKPYIEHNEEMGLEKNHIRFYKEKGSSRVCVYHHFFRPAELWVDDNGNLIGDNAESLLDLTMMITDHGVNTGQILAEYIKTSVKDATETSGDAVSEPEWKDDENIVSIARVRSHEPVVNIYIRPANFYKDRQKIDDAYRSYGMAASGEIEKEPTAKSTVVINHLLTLDEVFYDKGNDYDHSLVFKYTGMEEDIAVSFEWVDSEGEELPGSKGNIDLSKAGEFLGKIIAPPRSFDIKNDIALSSKHYLKLTLPERLFSLSK